jgi:hypothetical protein
VNDRRGDHANLEIDMTLLGARHFKMRHAIELAMMTASFAAGGEAMADCTPAGPVNNTIVTCTGP